jgi:hypothetical protein
MPLVNQKIDATNLSPNTKTMYKRALAKIGIIDTQSLHDTDMVLKRIESNFVSDESKKIALNAVCKVTENTDIFDIYNEHRNQIKRKIEYDKSDNTRNVLPMSYSDMLNVPNLVKNKDPKQELIDKFFLYMHTHYPLRLDYYNIPINKKDTNYMTYDGKILTFYLNQFKNVKSMGPQIITYDDPIIRDYLDTLKPDYLLYEKEGKTFNSRVAFGNHLSNLFKKYAGVKVTINDIRKITESNVIQGAGYNKLSNREKNKIHNKLLHQTHTANQSYNFVFKIS